MQMCISVIHTACICRIYFFFPLVSWGRVEVSACFCPQAEVQGVTGHVLPMATVPPAALRPTALLGLCVYNVPQRAIA